MNVSDWAGAGPGMGQPTYSIASIAWGGVYNNYFDFDCFRREVGR